jgi:hypothetical protein
VIMIMVVVILIQDFVIPPKGRSDLWWLWLWRWELLRRNVLCAFLEVLGRADPLLGLTQRLAKVHLPGGGGQRG